MSVAQYVAPATLADALQVLGEHGSDARILVGGTDLLVGYRHLIIDPTAFVDLKTVHDLPESFVVEDGHLRVGPTFTMAALAATPLFRNRFHALVEAANLVGSVAIRNRASLLGNVCNASPAADTVPALLLHDATVVIAGAGGQREVSLPQFFLGPRSTQCGPGEVVVQLDIPVPADMPGTAFQRLTRRRGVDLASVSVAAAVYRGGRIRLGMGAVGPKTLLSEVNDVDVADDGDVERALDELLAVATPISDVRASRDYREATLRALAKRAIATAAHRVPERTAP